MPRPKRSKVAPSAPITLPHLRVREAENTATAAQKKIETFLPESYAQLKTSSDDSDGLVVKRKDGQQPRSKYTQEYTMSGALGLENVINTGLEPISRKTRPSLNNAVKGSEHAQKEGRIKTSGRTKGGDAQALDAAQPESIPSSIPAESVTRMPQSTDKRRSSPRHPSQGLSGSRSQETPRLGSSLLGGAGFRKRARQPSLLQMVHSQGRPEDEVDDDDMYNFLPDDESTPFSKSLSQNLANPMSSSSRQTSSSRKRKQAQPEIQFLASQSQSPPPQIPRSPSPQRSPDSEDLYGVSGEEENVQPTLPYPRSTTMPQPQIFSDTMAPPESSSPVQPKPQPKSQSKSSKPAKAPPKPKARIKQPKKQQLFSAPPPPSSPSTQASPARPTPAQPLSTATLQNLLPRRRVRPKARNEYDVLSSSDVEFDRSGLGEHDDELSFHTGKIRRNNSGAKLSKSTIGKRADTAKRNSTTYSRKTAVDRDDNADEENEAVSDGEADEDTTGSPVKRQTPALDEQAKLEMKRLADKFREVDEYDLDFEDMTGSSSQMRDAR